MLEVICKCVQDLDIDQVLQELPLWRRNYAIKYRQLKRKLTTCVSFLELCKVLKRDPRATKFSYHEHGKPYIVSEKPFNISHAENVVAVITSSNSEVGIDVESTSTLQVLQDLAAKSSIFSEEEVGYPHLLTKFWTLKEAFLKMNGTGLTDVPLKNFNFAQFAHASDFNYSGATFHSERRTFDQEYWVSWCYNTSDAKNGTE